MLGKLFQPVQPAYEAAAFFSNFARMNVQDVARLPINGFFFFFLLLSFAPSCKKSASANYERIERFADGSVKSRVQIVNGKKEGLMIDYYQDGKVWGERLFQNDLQTGRTVFYYPEGRIKEVQYYVEGKRQGGDTIWYQDGHIQFIVQLENDKKNGYMRKWSPEGVLVYEARFEMDTLVEVKGEPIRVRRNPGALDTSRVR